MMLILLGIDLATAVKMEDLTSVLGHLFHHHLIYSDLHIARRITEDYDIELSARQREFASRIAGYVATIIPCPMKLRTRKLAPSMQSNGYSQKAIYGNIAIDNSLHTLLADTAIALERVEREMSVH
jgi:hypothetical protein